MVRIAMRASVSLTPGWDTADKVCAGNRRFYSSKPTLCTVAAGEYFCCAMASSFLPWIRTASRSPGSILLTINWLPFVLYLLLLASRSENDQGRDGIGSSFRVRRLRASGPSSPDSSRALTIH